MFIPGPDIYPFRISDPGSRIPDLGSRIPDLGSRIQQQQQQQQQKKREEKICCLSGIRKNLSLIPNPRVKKALNQCGSETLHSRIRNLHVFGKDSLVIENP
jgi:hypothetical protein